jgi:hypothetical protein
VHTYRPADIAGERRRAIAWTASADAVVEMVRDSKLPARGFLRQENIPLAQLKQACCGWRIPLLAAFRDGLTDADANPCVRIKFRLIGGRGTLIPIAT